MKYLEFMHRNHKTSKLYLYSKIFKICIYFYICIYTYIYISTHTYIILNIKSYHIRRSCFKPEFCCSNRPQKLTFAIAALDKTQVVNDGIRISIGF